jgi:hypothetical protein
LDFLVAETAVAGAGVGSVTGVGVASVVGLAAGGGWGLGVIAGVGLVLKIGAVFSAGEVSIGATASGSWPHPAGINPAIIIVIMEVIARIKDFLFPMKPPTSSISLHQIIKVTSLCNESSLDLTELRCDFLDYFLPAHPLDGDSLVPAGLAPDDAHCRLLYSQFPAEKSYELPVGFPSLRRSGDFHLEHPAAEACYLVPAGVGGYLQQEPVVIGPVFVIQIVILFLGDVV